MNWGTMVQLLQERLSLDATHATRLKRAICDSIVVHRRSRFRWNQDSTQSVTLTQYYGSYSVTADAPNGIAAGLPSKVVAFIGKKAHMDYLGDAQQRQSVFWIPREKMDEFRNGPAVSGIPQWWTFWDEKLEVYPPSDNSTNIFRCAAIIDVGTPIYSYAAGAWSFFKPDGVAPMVDAYGDTSTAADYNPWFDLKKGFGIIANHVEFLMWSGVLDATRDEISKAQTRYLEALSAEEEITAGQSAGRQNDPYIPG